MDIHAAAKALGGHVSRGKRDQISCPGPGHTSGDRSLSVRFTGNGRFVVKSFAGQDWRECHDYVYRVLFAGQKADIDLSVRTDSDSDSQQDTKQALEMWDNSEADLRANALAYLKRRAVSYTGSALRFQKSGCFGSYRYIDSIVALVKNIVTDEPQAIQQTAIDTYGYKLGHLGGKGRWNTGPIGGGAIKLFENVTSILGIAEGLETALSIRTLPDFRDIPVWSVLFANGLERFPVIRGLQRVVIAADHDISGTGKKVAHAARDRLKAAGISVTILCPKEVGTDLNDLVMRHAAR